MPAIAVRAVWEKVTKGRAGIRWDSVVEKAWKDLVGNQEELLIVSIDKFGGYKTQVEEMIRNKEKASHKKQGETRGTLKRYTGG